MRLTRTALLLAAASLFVGCPPGHDLTEVRVMTWNLAIGIELEPILGAPSWSAIPPLVQTAWTQRTTSDFSKRVGRIADGIQASGADVVGLQEVVDFFTSTTSTPIPTPATTPATNPPGDFLAMLLAELASRNLGYALATDGTTDGVVSNADIQLPGTQGEDYRVVDREAVLVRSGITVSRVRTGNYVAELLLGFPGPTGATIPFRYKRGWVAVDAVKNGKAFTVLSTHLDAFSPGVQGAQAHELLGLLPPGMPALVLGDMNSDPQDAAWPAWGILVSPTTGLADTARDVGASGKTCCRDALCSVPEPLPPSDPSYVPQLTRRVDLVLHSPHFEAQSVALHGAAQADYSTTSQLWPSDHAGVSAVLGLE